MQPRLLQPRTGDRWVCPSERQALGQNVGVNKKTNNLMRLYTCVVLRCFVFFWLGFFNSSF